MPKPDIHRMIRVDQAGEFGATRIYAGQLAVMGDRGPHSAEIAGMAEQEAQHRAKFDALMARRGVRPTALQPFWSVAGYALGAATALLGPEAAMACTAAVEEEIDRHYSEQLDALDEDGDDPELAEMIEQFREDEREHRDAAIAAGAENAPAYPLLSGLIRLGCRTAIRVSERILTHPSQERRAFRRASDPIHPVSPFMTGA
jgi:ubiquinone biosynthesis monooxygenase Coq7